MRNESKAVRQGAKERCVCVCVGQGQTRRGGEGKENRGKEIKGMRAEREKESDNEVKATA